MDQEQTIQVNRAPVLTLWALVVAERLGCTQDEALTLGRAMAGLNAHTPALLRQPRRSTTPPILDVNDFVCFQHLLSVGDPNANCDGSVLQPLLNINDFTCFFNRYAAGCPQARAPPARSRMPESLFLIGLHGPGAEAGRHQRPRMMFTVAGALPRGRWP